LKIRAINQENPENQFNHGIKLVLLVVLQERQWKSIYAGRGFLALNFIRRKNLEFSTSLS
jgi:hypothetical protein